MSALEKLPEAATFACPEAAAVLDQLRSGAPFVLLLVDQVERRAASLETVLDEMADAETKIVWIGNPLRSPLTIERVFLQAVGAEADLRVERSPADLALILTRSAGAAKRLLLILQQPETLDPEARDALAGMAGFLPLGEPRVQILFAGTSSFAPLQRRQAMVSVASRTLIEPEEIEPSAPRRLESVPLLMLLLLTGLGALMTPALLQSSRPSDRATPEPMTAHAAPPPSIAAPPQPAALDVAALRREFDAFLAQRAPTIPALSDSQKDALFQEFLERHRQTHALEAL